MYPKQLYTLRIIFSRMPGSEGMALMDFPGKKFLDYGDSLPNLKKSIMSKRIP